MNKYKYSIGDRVKYYKPIEGYVGSYKIGTIVDIQNQVLTTYPNKISSIYEICPERDLNEKTSSTTLENDFIEEIHIMNRYEEYHMDDLTLRNTIASKIWAEREYYKNKYMTEPKYIKFPSIFTVIYNPLIHGSILGCPVDMLLGLQICATDSISTIEEIEVF